MNSHRMRAARLALGPAVASLCIWLAIRHLDWSAVSAAWHGASAAWLGVSLAILALGYAMRIVRWRLMLRTIGCGSREPVSFTEAAGPLMAGMALNNVLPFRAGDIIRTTAFCRELKLPMTRVLGTMVLERVLDLTTLVVVFFIGLRALPAGTMPPAVVDAIAAAAALSVLALIVLLTMPGVLRRLTAPLRRAHRPAIATVGSWIAEFLDSLDAMRCRRLVVPVMAASVAIWLLEGGVFAAVAMALGLIPASQPLNPAAWFAMTTGTLGTLVPGTPGYVGTFDYFTMIGLTASGIAREPALVCAVLVHAVLWAPITAIGLMWLGVAKGRAWRGAVDEAEAA